MDIWLQRVRAENLMYRSGLASFGYGAGLPVYVVLACSFHVKGPLRRGRGGAVERQHREYALAGNVTIVLPL